MLNECIIFVNEFWRASRQTNGASEQQKTWRILTDTPHLITKIIKYGKYQEFMDFGN